MILGVEETQRGKRALSCSAKEPNILLLGDITTSKSKPFRGRTLETKTEAGFCILIYQYITQNPILTTMIAPRISKVRTGKVTRSKTYRTMVQAAEEHHMQCHAARVPDSPEP